MTFHVAASVTEVLAAAFDTDAAPAAADAA
jgi:hypothetical protein